MGALPRPRAVVIVAVAILAAASAVVPVRVAWSAPQVRFLELAAPRGRTISVPLGRVVLPPVGAAAIPFPASHLGVRWTGDEAAAVEVRSAPGPGSWGPWRPVAVAHDLGDDARDEVLSGLVRADGARLVQARARGGGARRIRVVAIDAVNGPRRLVRASSPPAGAQVAQPDVVPRSGWGADESMRRGTPIHAPVSRIIVHHTVTPNDDPDPAATMRAMYAYHVLGRGWDDLGYNFVVDAAGRVYEGRHARAYGPGEVPTGESPDGEGVVGAHAEGANAGSVGIAVMGTFTARQPPVAAVDAVQRLLAWKADRHGIDPTGSAPWGAGAVPTIAGHRDVGRTDCPGDQLYARLPALRQAVATAVATARAAVTPGYLALGRDGRVLAFGRALAPLGGVTAAIAAPAAAIAVTPSGLGYWVVTDAGRVVPAGDALLLGSPELVGAVQPAGRAVAIEPTPSGLGYWVLEQSGRVRAFGDAPDLGPSPGGTAVAISRTPSGRGYWVATADGRVSAHGDAPALGSAGRLAAPVVALTASPDGNGYWLVAGDGRVLPFGRAVRAGGLPQRGVAARIVAARATASGRGYYLLGADGAVFTFGDAAFHGAPVALAAGGGAVGLAPVR